MTVPASKEGKTNSALDNFVDDVVDRTRESIVPIYIAVLAAFLALVSLINDNTEREAFRAHLEATNQFAFFQAKTIRMTDSQIAAQTLQALNKPELAKPWADKAARYKTERGEILTRAKAEQQIREVAQSRTGFYEAAIALLQIAIVLATAYLLVKNRMLMAGSMGLTVIALLAAANGYTLFMV